MKEIFGKNTTPISITLGGFLLVAVLASAPALLAESDAEILTKKNQASLESLTTLVEDKIDGLEQNINAQVKSNESRFSNIENQLAILHKATSNLHRRQQSQKSDPGEEMAKMAGFASFDKNADARMINLEKAVTRMHLSLRTQMGSTETVDQSIADSELRLTELEDSVSKLRVESGTVIASAKPADTNNQNTEQLQQMLEDITDQLQAMQQTSQQAMQQSIQQTSQPVPRSVQSRSANRNISVKTDVQQLQKLYR